MAEPTGRVTLAAAEWSVLRRGTAEQVKAVIAAHVAAAKADALREAAVECLAESTRVNSSAWRAAYRNRAAWLTKRASDEEPA